MTNNTDDQGEHDLLSQVLDDYAAWYGRVLRAAYYPDAQGPDVAAHPPESFERWYTQATADIEDNAALVQIRQQYDALVSAAGTIVDESHVQKPDLSRFDKLRENFDEFLSKLRRIDYDRLSGDFGIDVLTGLRSQKVMLEELEREMERRARRGMPFTLVFVHIDNYDCLQDKADTQDLCDIIRKSADAIKTCMRSVDDAYRLSEKEFLVSLKHADMDGAIRFCDRVKQHCVDKDVRYSYGDQQIPLVLSFCSGEPLPGDELETLISNLQNDLKTHYKGPGTSVVYQDTAPIERYVKAIQGD